MNIIIISSWQMTFLYILYIVPAKNHSLEEEFGETVLLKSLLNNFPAALLGKELTNATRLIFLYGATWNQKEKKMV